MPIERELRFRMPDHIPAGRLWCLAGQPDTRQTLTTYYYDTPRRSLFEARAALRLRRAGRSCVQTFKSDSNSGGALLARHEWEIAAPGGRLRPGAFPSAEIRDLTGIDLRALEPQLGVAFSTRFVRQRRVIRSLSGARIELALDQGWIRARRAGLLIRELELELLDGEVDDLLALAHRWLSPLALRLEVESKAERGYALVSRTAHRARATGAPCVSRRTSVPEAAVRVLESSLRHVAANVEGLIERRESEWLHQLRVGLRRLRTAIRIFQVLWPARDIEPLVATLRTATPPLSAARDMDVLLAQVQAEAGSALLVGISSRGLQAAVRRARIPRLRAARDAVSAPVFQALLLDILALTLKTPGTCVAPDSSRPAAFVRGALRKLARRAERDGRGCDWTQAAQCHALRIRLKRLRYGCEFFRCVLEQQQRVRAYIKRLERLQDLLGELNDIETAGPILERMARHAKNAEASAFMRGRFSVRAERLRAELPGAWRAFEQAGRPF